MSVIMEVAKQSGSPKLIMKEDYNSLEKEIAFTEKDFRRFVNKRRF